MMKTRAAVALLTSSLMSASISPSPVYANDGIKTVGFVTAAIGIAFYGAMKCSAEKTAKAEGIKLLWQGSQSISPRDEMQVLQAVAAQKPAGIILVPWDSTAFVAPAKQLMDQGTPLITADATLAEPVAITNIRTNNREAGGQAAKELAAMVGGKGSVLVLTASPANIVQNERWQGFKEVIDRDFKEMEVLPVQYIGADASKAASVTTSTIVSNPNLIGVFGTMDAGAEGAANAVRAAGKKGRIRIVGYDATLRQVEQLKSGDLDALVAQSPAEIGIQMIQAMSKVLKVGAQEAALPKQIYTPFKFLTQSNVNDPDSKRFIYETDCTK